MRTENDNEDAENDSPLRYVKQPLKTHHEPLDPNVVHLIAINNPFDISNRVKEWTDWHEGMTLRDALGDLNNDDWVVTLNGGLYDESSWETTPVYKGDCIVGVAVPHGGGGGNNNAKMALRMVALIAITVVSYGYGAAALGPMLTGVGGMTAGTAAMVGGTVMSVGASMLANAILPPPSPEIGEAPGGRTYGIDGPKATSETGLPVPVCYGGYTMSGNVVTMFTEASNNIQLLYMLINAGEGPIQGISSIYVNNTPIEQFNSTDLQTRNGTANQTVIPSFSQTIVPVNINATLVTADAWQYHTTTNECTRMKIDMVFPEGVGRTTSSGKFTRITIPFRIEYRVSGSGGAWTGFGAGYQWGDNEGGDGGTYGIHGGYQGVLRRSYWTAAGLTYAKYEVRFCRLNNERPDQLDAIVVVDIAEVNETLLQYNNTAMIGFRLKMNEEINSIPNITYFNEGKLINVWTGSVWATEASDNPAWIARDMLTNERYGAGIPEERIDDDAFKEWAISCTDRDLVFRGVMDRTTSIWDAMGPVYRAGRALPIRIGSRYSVSIEEPKPSSMLFSAGNMKEGSLQLGWLPIEDRTNDFEITFYDKLERHKQRTINVYDDNELQAGIKMRKGRITLEGIDEEERAMREGVFMLNINKLVATASWESDVSAIAVTIGDVVDVQADMPQWGYGGRVENVSGSTITVDKLIPFEAGSYNIRFLIPSGSGDTISEYGVSNPGTDAQTFSVGGTSGVQKGTIYSVGKVDKVTKPFVVRSISQSGDHMRTISALEYNEDVHGDDVIGYEDTHSDLGLRLSPVQNVQFFEEIDPTINGDGIRLAIEWEHTDPDYWRADAYYAPEGFGEWILIGTDNSRVVINDVDIDITYHVVIVPINTDGLRSDFDAQPVHQYMVTGTGFGIPETPVSFTAAALSRSIDMTWYIPSKSTPGPQNDVGNFLIYWAPHYDTVSDPVPTYDDSVLVGNTTNNFWTHFDRVPDTDNYYWLVNASKFDPENVRSPVVPCSSNPVHTLTETFQSVFGRGVEDYDLSEPLSSRIDLIDEPISGLVDRMVDAEGDILSNEGNITTLESTVSGVQGGVDANATAISGLDTRVTDNEGDITAQATDITALQTTVDDPSTGLDATASAVNALTTRVTTNEDDIATKAEASELTTLQTTVNGNTSSIQVHANSIDGLEGQYTVKIDNSSGHVAGFGLSNTSSEFGGGHSEFLVLVDRFAVASPGNTDLSFEIESGEVRMDGAKIKDASIDNLKIGNIIKSNTFLPSSGRGWQIDKTGKIEVAEFAMYDHDGDLIMEAGRTYTNYSSLIDNTQQAWSQISDIPDSLESVALNRFSQSAYGNVQISLDDPSAGKMKFIGDTIYLPDGTKMGISSGVYLECWMRSGINEDALVVCYSPTSVKTVVSSSHSTSGSTTENFWISRMYKDGSVFAVDGLGAYREWDPDDSQYTVVAIATCSRPAGTGSGTNFATFNSLIGANLFLPEDGANLSGADNIVPDGSFEFLYATQGANTEIVESQHWKSEGTRSDVRFTYDPNAGPCVKLGDNGSTDCYLRTNQFFSVSPYEKLYCGVTLFGGNSAGDFHVLIQYFDQNFVGHDHTENTYTCQKSGNTGGWIQISGVGTVPVDAAWAKASIRQRNSDGNHWLVSQFVVSRAPTQITYETAPTYIKDLSVDTLQIANRAVSVPLAVKTTASHATSNSVYVTLVTSSTFKPTSSSIPIHVWWMVEPLSMSSNNINVVKLYRGSTEIFTKTIASNGEIIGGVFCYVDESHGGASINYNVRYSSSGSISNKVTSLIVHEIYK